MLQIAYGFWKKNKRRHLRMFVILWKKWKKLASSSINQSVKRQKQCVHSRILLLWQKVCVKRHQHQFTLNKAEKWACDRLSEDADFGKKKKSSFQMKLIGGYVNKQNCRISGIENPHAYIEHPTHPKRITVWCNIIGSFFSENEQGEAVTVNGDRYRAMLNENWRRGYWQHLVSTERRYVPHSRSYIRCFAPCFWTSHYQP